MLQRLYWFCLYVVFKVWFRVDVVDSRRWQGQMFCRSWTNGGGGYISGRLGHPRDANEAVYVTPSIVSFCVEPRGETHARVACSIEMLMPRTCGLFESGMHHIHDQHCCHVLHACINKWVFLWCFLLLKTGIDNARFSLHNQCKRLLDFPSEIVCTGPSFSL